MQHGVHGGSFKPFYFSCLVCHHGVASEIMSDTNIKYKKIFFSLVHSRISHIIPLIFLEDETVMSDQLSYIWSRGKCPALQWPTLCAAQSQRHSQKSESASMSSASIKLVLEWMGPYPACLPAGTRAKWAILSDIPSVRSVSLG